MHQCVFDARREADGRRGAKVKLDEGQDAVALAPVVPVALQPRRGGGPVMHDAADGAHAARVTPG